LLKHPSPLSHIFLIMRVIRFAWLVAGAAAHASPASAPKSTDDPYMGDPALGEGEEVPEEEVGDAFMGLPDQNPDENSLASGIDEEQMKRLFEHMDADKDGKVPVAELHVFAKAMRHKIAHAADKSGDETGEMSMFASLDLNKDDRLSFDEAFPSDETMEDWIKHEQAKFKAADKNKDGLLDEQEYPAYTHPEIDDAVEEAYARSLFDGKDVNKDGVLDYEEVFGTYSSGAEGDVVDSGAEGAAESYLEDFKSLDRNGNGKIDFEEAKAWESGRHDVEMAMEFLASHADTNKDGQVTVDEFVAARQGLETHSAGYHLEEWSAHLEL